MQLTYAFFIAIAVIFPLSCIAVATGGNKDRNLSKAKMPVTKVFVFLVFVAIFIFTAFRHISGTNIDEYAYRNRIISYKDMPFGTMLTSKIEWLAAIPTWILSNITQNTQWIIIWASLITYAILVYCIKTYCDNFEFGILLLFLLNIVNQSFNTMQQVESAAVLMLGIPYIYQKKFWKYLVIVIIASLIHSSAILMLALYPIANMKPWSAKFVGVAGLFIVIMLVFNSMAGTVLSSLGVYENYSDTIASGRGVKLITIIVSFVPVTMAFLFRNILPKDDPLLNCCINVAMIYAMIYLVASQQIYVARFAIFIQPWLIVFYTKALTYLKKEKYSVPVYYVLTLGYGATMVYFTRSLTYTFMA